MEITLSDAELDEVFGGRGLQACHTSADSISCCCCCCCGGCVVYA